MTNSTSDRHREAARELVYGVRGWQQRSPEFCVSMTEKWAEILAKHFPSSSSGTGLVEELKAVAARIAGNPTICSQFYSEAWRREKIEELILEALRNAEAGRQDEVFNSGTLASVNGVPVADSKPSEEKTGEKCPSCGSPDRDMRWCSNPNHHGVHKHIRFECIRCPDPWHNAPSAIGEKGNEDGAA